MERPFAQGLRDGLPVACAYLAVSFGFGIMCRSAGLGTLAATLISGLNLSSAGQAAGLAVIRAGGTLIEMALTQLVINLRYSLMALSLSQKLTPEFGTFHRLVASFGITDVISLKTCIAYKLACKIAFRTFKNTACIWIINYIHII